MLFWLLLACGNAAMGQPLYLRHFTVDEGLPSNEVYQVTEDKAGHLLIATDRGAARFDGYGIEPIPLEQGQTVMPVYYIFTGADGSIFFSGLRGHLYKYRGGRLNAFPHNAALARQYKNGGILIANTLAAVGDSLFISFNNDYPTNLEIGSRLVLPNGKVERVDAGEGFYFDLRNQFHHREYKEAHSAQKAQAVYIAWPDGGRSVDSVRLFWSEGYVRRLFTATLNGYHLFCIGRHVLVYKNRKKVGSHVFDKNVLSFSVLRNGTLGVGFQSGGAAAYALADGRLQGPLQTQLGNLSVTALYEDRQNGLWLSTIEDGLYYASPSRTTLSAADDKIKYLERRNDSVLIAYASGKLAYYTGGRPVWQTFVPVKKGEFLMRFSFQPNGGLIAVTNSGYYAQEGGRWRFVPSMNLELLAVNDSLVYGTDLSYPRLHLYKGYTEKVVKTIGLPSRALSAYMDRQGRLWLGTWEGLYTYDGKALTAQTGRHAAFSDRIVGIKELSSGWLAVATLGNGLLLLKGERTIHLSAANGLESGIINSLRADGNTAYLGTNKGVVAVAVDEGGTYRLSHFGAAAGLPTLDISQFAVAQGQLFGKWVNQVFHLSIAPPAKPFVPAVYLQAVTVNGRRKEPGDAAVLNHRQNALTFHYASVNLSGAGQQSFKYQLDGFEKRPHWTAERSATYTNLPPGRYSFRVAVTDGFRQTKSTQSFSFVIRPAFWQTAPFPWAVAAAGLLLAYLLFRLRLRASKRTHELRMRLAEANQRALIQLINPHFISNLLNTVHAAVLKGNKMEAASTVSRFARLMRLTMELGREKFVLLERELGLIREYLELEKLRAPERFCYRIVLAEGLQPERLRIPGMLIQPFVENAVKHGVMHLPHKGEITVEVTMKEQCLQCRITDNGIGIEKARRINANKMGLHVSAGIGITLNRLMLLHQESKQPLLYEVDTLDAQNPDHPGTAVTFSLPYKQTE